MIGTEIPTWEDPPALPKSNYRASGLVLRPKADTDTFILASGCHTSKLRSPASFV